MGKTNNTQNKTHSVAEVKDWIGEANLMYGGLAGLGVIMIQPFMYQGEFTGTAAMVCVVAFAVSTPILATLLLLNHEENFKKHLSKSVVVSVCRGVGQAAAVIGFVAGFWHIHPIAGQVAIASGVFAAIAYTMGYNALKNKKYF